ncbi:MAG: dihydroorotate dehydrogenase [Phycisphaerales bacterium]
MGYTPSTRLSTTLCGIPLRSPIFLASGTAGTLDETSDVLDTSILGGIVTKSITRHPRQGNPYPRITWTRAGMLNAIGLANPGLDAWKSDIAPNIKPTPTNFVGSVAGDSIDDYVQIASAMDAVDAMKIVELNVSCPNVHSGLEFGADPAALKDLVTHVRSSTPDTKLFVKLSPITVGTPNTIVDLAKVAVDAGADGLTLCNTVPAMGIDVHTRKPILANTTGGMSGPSIHPITVRLVHLVYSQLTKNTGTPIMAAGGVTRWEDAAEFILAGATTVQIGAGSLADLNTPRRVIKGLDKWCVKQNASSITELVGQVKL